MEYHPDKRDEILAERIKAELRRKHLYPSKQSEKSTPQSAPSPLDKRLEELRKGKEAIKTKWTEFLDSEENQKKYGFRTKTENGVRNIYYDGDFNVLEEAVFGPVTFEERLEPDLEKCIRLTMIDNHMFARLPKAVEDCAVKIRVGTAENEEPNFAIVTDDNTVLVRLSLIDPAYHPNEESCPYSIDMKGLIALNGYMRHNFDNLIQEWNRMHPEYQLNEGIPIPNYRFLASAAYLSTRIPNATL